MPFDGSERIIRSKAPAISRMIRATMPVMGYRASSADAVLPLGVIAICAASAHAGTGWPAALAVLAAAAGAAALWPRSSRALRACLAILALAAAAGRVHAAWLEQTWNERSSALLAAQLDDLRRHSERLLGDLRESARQAASIPDAGTALRGQRPALALAFRQLEALQRERPDQPSLALHGPSLAAVAWTGRIGELASLRALLPEREVVFVVETTLSTTLLATAPVRTPQGESLGLATAELPLAVRRNIRNEYLQDFDRLIGDAPNLEVRYFDLRDPAEDQHPLPPLPPGAPSHLLSLRSPSGASLALVRGVPPPLEDALVSLDAVYGRVLAGLGLVALLFLFRERPPSRLRLAALATAARALLAALPLPWPGPGSALLAPDAFRVPLPLPAALADTPLAVLLTSAYLALLAALAAGRSLERAPQRRHPALRTLLDGLGLALAALAFAWIETVSRRASVELESVALLPHDPVALALQLSLLLALAAAALLLFVLLLEAGTPTSRGGLVGRAAAWVALAAIGEVAAPDAVASLPVPALLALFAGVALAATTSRAWRPRLATASEPARAALGLAGIGTLALLLYPAIARFAEAELRRAIVEAHAPTVLQQPEWRDRVLREAQGQVDALGVLESEPPGAHPPDVEELAFTVWSATELARLGFSSAVEIQDDAGFVISRFASNLPTVSRRRPVPKDDGWLVTRERISVASAERPVLHARRLLSYSGRVHGAIHLYVGDDLLNLPFVSGRDPYAVLYRPARDARPRGRPLGLLVYDGRLRPVFSSAERPPLLDRETAEQVRRAPSGLWTTLALDGQLHDVYLFTDRRSVFGIGYPRLDAGRTLADVLEGTAGAVLLGLLGLLLLLALRSLLGRETLSIGSLLRAVRQRFALRLFAAFLLVAFVPVVVLQAVVGRFVAERLHREAESQALDLAAVARRAVEDFALFQRDEAPGDALVTDAALVWVASLIRNDLDVFGGGRLLASSKRELYASGLLAPRVPGPVFRELVLEERPFTLRQEQIGGFAYQVVSVPVRLDSPAPGVLSIPLALRQRDVEQVVRDLERTVRLAAALFLAAAAAIALSVSRRISGPVRDLTRATGRVAAGDFTTRVAAPVGDELGRLGDAFNSMAEELERQRADLERSNRLAAWAEMARQVAHEIKNPLTPIQLSAEHLRRVFGDPRHDFGRVLETCTATILEQVKSLREIATEFSAFARPPAQSPEDVALGALLDRVTSRYRRVMPEGVSLSLETAPELPPVRGDRRLLERAVVNLIENALQAVGDAGSIRVGLRVEGQSALVEVEDSGPGLDTEARARVFEPFFSTRSAGSGLGLALVKKIAEDHGGSAALRSEPGEPTRASLRLPLRPPPSAPV
jgi:signal transduction histidine kinase